MFSAPSTSERHHQIPFGRCLVIARRSHVTLTDEGHALIDEVLPHHIETEQRVLAALPKERRDDLADTLRALLESLGDTTGPT
ncbi:MarR family winged helix-turn-helix transcriptional regulator [Nonomuraea diastatica]|uniref:MarR family winged helix-turn-helix transcriptional regulator n=1 Tax=Nonomuraea diastatica TaxID=1848329 RepID=UPI001C7022DB|nr:MarR family winged helix-turn-helix transcriptional regulator [Nonomuraea diastatica]